MSSGRNIVNTFLTSSTTGTSFTPAVRISSQGNQPEYEMFSNRDLPFYGDYNWLNLARLAGGGLLGYTAWTDNRDVVAGADHGRASTTASTSTSAAPSRPTAASVPTPAPTPAD